MIVYLFDLLSISGVALVVPGFVLLETFEHFCHSLFDFLQFFLLLVESLDACVEGYWGHGWLAFDT